MSDLKPCPFCGGEAELESFEIDLNGEVCTDGFQVNCLKCGISLDEHTDYNECVENWNARESGWISVADKLPRVGEYVIAYLDFGVVATMVFSNLHEFKSPHHASSSWSGSVTHWMPLPSPPTN